MASANDRQRNLSALFAVLSTAVLVWFGTGLEPKWPLLWFAPLPVLLFAMRNSWWSTGIVAFVSWLAGSLNMWHYFHGVLHAPAPVWAGIFSGATLVFTVAVLFFRALVLRGAWWSALLAFPAAWVSFEYLFNLISIHGTAGS